MELNIFHFSMTIATLIKMKEKISTSHLLVHCTAIGKSC